MKRKYQIFFRGKYYTGTHKNGFKREKHTGTLIYTRKHNVLQKGFLLETDYKKSTQTFYFIALLILKIMLKAIQISKQHILRIPKW